MVEVLAKLGRLARVRSDLCLCIAAVAVLGRSTGSAEKPSEDHSLSNERRAGSITSIRGDNRVVAAPGIACGQRAPVSRPGSRSRNDPVVSTAIWNKPARLDQIALANVRQLHDFSSNLEVRGSSHQLDGRTRNGFSRQSLHDPFCSRKIRCFLYVFCGLLSSSYALKTCTEWRLPRCISFCHFEQKRF
jgi:hypothetical protein